MDEMSRRCRGVVCFKGDRFVSDSRYPEILLTMLDELYIHPLCDYLYDLSSCFSEFYDNCYCIVKNKTTGNIESVNMSRMALCEATAQVMEMAFRILGIRTVERM